MDQPEYFFFRAEKKTTGQLILKSVSALQILNLSSPNGYCLNLNLSKLIIKNLFLRKEVL